MAISPVGPYTPVRTAARPVTTQSYTPSTPTQPGGAYPGGAYYAQQPSTVTVGRMAAWGGGAFAAIRYGLPLLGRTMGGWWTLGAAAAGALVGNKVYNAVTGAGVSPTGQGTFGRYVAWAGGAFGAFRLGTSMMRGGQPTGLALGALLAGGAWAGNWIYNKLTGR